MAQEIEHRTLSSLHTKLARPQIARPKHIPSSKKITKPEKDVGGPQCNAPSNTPHALHCPDVQNETSRHNTGKTQQPKAGTVWGSIKKQRGAFSFFSKKEGQVREPG